MTDRTRPETPVGQPLGDTGDGDTGVPDDEQGMSNRPGDRAEDSVDIDVKHDDIKSDRADDDEDEDLDGIEEVAEDDEE